MGKKIANTGSKRVPSPNPEKRVRPEVRKVATEITKYCIPLGYIESYRNATVMTDKRISTRSLCGRKTVVVFVGRDGKYRKEWETTGRSNLLIQLAKTPKPQSDADFLKMPALRFEVQAGHQNPMRSQWCYPSIILNSSRKRNFFLCLRFQDCDQIVSKTIVTLIKYHD
jgi:hypothetical protein